MIYYIYWGTSGNSGLYLHEIYHTLEKHGFQQFAFEQGVLSVYNFLVGNTRRGEVKHSASISCVLTTTACPQYNDYRRAAA